MNRRAAVLLLLAAMSAAACAAPPTRTTTEVDKPLPDGLYAVVPDGTSKTMRILVHDPRALDPASTEPRERIGVDESDFVPLVLAKPPAIDDATDERVRLEIALVADQAPKLRAFTSEHLGDRAAIVLAGHVMSIHRIKSVVEGGRLQITRCGDEGCTRVLARLLRGDAGV